MVVDDDDMVADVVSLYLSNAGHQVVNASDGATALQLAKAALPDLVVLDLMLPGVSGMDVCGRLQDLGPIAVIMLTARDGEDERIAGLRRGADDYVTKPFSPRELVARVDAVLRRTRAPARPETVGRIEDGNLLIDAPAREVTLDGRVVGLTAREYDLLSFLARNPRVAFSREELLERVWDWTFGDVSTVTVHVRRLREKIEADPANPERLVTIWGLGYRYEPAGASP